MLKPNNWLTSAVGLAAFALSVAATEPPTDSIAFAWAISPTAKVGSKKSGLACLPNGKLLWEEIARPDMEVLNSRLAKLLGERGMGITSAHGRLIDIRVSLCSPWMGIGAAPRSETSLTAEWELDGARQIPLTTVTTETKRSGVDARHDSSLLLEAVESNLNEALDRRNR